MLIICFFYSIYYPILHYINQTYIYNGVRAYICTYLHLYVMCQKSHVSTKYAQTFATSALLYTHTLLSTCKESGIAQHKSNNSLSMLCSPPSLIYKTTPERTRASLLFPLLATHAVGGALLLEMRLALLCQCFRAFAYSLSNSSRSLSPSLTSLVFRLLLLVPPGPDTVLAVRRRVFVSFLVCAVRRRSG